MDSFEEHRALLEGIAYRMCGVLADAQDVVQETYLRWQSQDHRTIDNPRAWLVTVCSRLAIDVMKSARKRREAYVGTWLPEPFVDDSAADPAKQACIDDTISMALMLALEKLSPSERASFLLHEVFAYGFEEIAGILGKSKPACRKLASRAKAAIRDAKPRFRTTPEEHQRLVHSFFEAVHTGEMESLKALLADSVELHADGGGKVETAPNVLLGRESVSRFFRRIWQENVPSRESVHIVTRWFNGSPGALIVQSNSLVAALHFVIEAGEIKRIYAVRNPDKLIPFQTGKKARLRQEIRPGNRGIRESD
jgi:RNA polymerase sigma-70 factor, ECF subfamily